MIDQTVLTALLQFLAHMNPTVLVLLLIVAIATPAGVVTVILLLYSSYQKHQGECLETYRTDVNRILENYGEDLRRVSRFYDDNVELVKKYMELAGDLKTVIVLNAQTMTKICDKIDSNQYCPYVRIKKESPGRIVE